MASVPESALPDVFISYQQKLMASVSAYAVTVAEKSRRTGFSWAIAASAVLIVCIGATVSLMRPNRGRSLAFAETFILLVAVAAVVVACALTFPGSAA